MSARSATSWFLGAAMLASAGVHLAGFGLTEGPEETMMEGGAPAQFARFGNSFADMVQGSNSPAQPDMPEDQPIDDAMTPTAPVEQAETHPPGEASIAPTGATRETPVEDIATEAPPAPTDAALPTSTLTQTPTLPMLTESATPVAVASAQPTAPTPPTPMAETTPTAAATESARSELDVVTGEAPVIVRSPDAATFRPQIRPDRREPVQQPRPTQQPRPQPSQASTGNEANTQRGQDDGRQEAQASTASQRPSGQAAQSGNAAAANYPGRVLRQLRRARRARVGARGVAMVGFRIAGSGGIASVYIISSSGNTRVDQAAMQHVHRAAPFPAPPRGAQTQFSFQYEARR